MKKHEVTQNVVEQILEVAKRQGTPARDLKKRRLELEAMDGAGIHAEWEKLNPQAKDTAKRLKDPKQDPDQLDTLVRVYSPRVRD